MAKYTKRRDKRGYEWKSAYREKEALMLEREYTEEVQKGRSSVADWTLKQWKGAQKSKRRKYVHGNSCQAGVCSHR